MKGALAYCEVLERRPDDPTPGTGAGRAAQSGSGPRAAAGPQHSITHPGGSCPNQFTNPADQDDLLRSAAADERATCRS